MGTVGHAGTQAASLDHDGAGPGFLPGSPGPEGHLLPLAPVEAPHGEAHVVVVPGGGEIRRVLGAVFRHHLLVGGEIPRGQDHALPGYQAEILPVRCLNDDGADAAIRLFQIPGRGAVEHLAPGFQEGLFQGGHGQGHAGARPGDAPAHEGVGARRLPGGAVAVVPIGVLQHHLQALLLQDVRQPVHGLLAAVPEGIPFPLVHLEGVGGKFLQEKAVQVRAGQAVGGHDPAVRGEDAAAPGHRPGAGGDDACFRPRLSGGKGGAEARQPLPYHHHVGGEGPGDLLLRNGRRRDFKGSGFRIFGHGLTSFCSWSFFPAVTLP